jgi:NAD(P)-dependent dehydrogenase (short-subunit alcohol dehydrogenase family)
LTQPFHISLGTADELAEATARVEALDRRILARKADVRDFKQLSAALAEGVAELGGVDIVLANAGIARSVMATKRIPRCWGATCSMSTSRGVEHRSGRGPGHDRGRTGRCHRLDQLHGRAERGR